MVCSSQPLAEVFHAPDKLLSLFAPSEAHNAGEETLSLTHDKTEKRSHH